jgi:hypothetical protein
MSKKITLILIITTFTLISLTSLLFYPLFNFKNNLNKKSLQSEAEYVINIYNPFKPKVSEILKLSGNEGYWVTVIDYQRTGLFEFTRLTSVDGIEKPFDIGQIDAKIDGKTLDEVKQIANKQDLSKTQYTPEKNNREKEFEDEQKKPVECQRALRIENSYEQSQLNLYKNMKYSELSDFAGEGRFDNDNNYFLIINLKNNEKYNLYFGKISPAVDDSIELSKVTKVYADCREEKISLPEEMLK